MCGWLFLRLGFGENVFEAEVEAKVRPLEVARGRFWPRSNLTSWDLGKSFEYHLGGSLRSEAAPRLWYTLISIIVAIFYLAVLPPRFFMSYAEKKMAERKKKTAISFTEKPIVNHDLKIQINNPSYLRLDDEAY